MIDGWTALRRLREGNRRFVAGLRDPDAATIPTKRAALVGGQEPFAIILGCSDSRVPAEIVFDQGLGDLFVIRVAGNIVAPSLIGSVEFATTKFGTRLVVVMGHSGCGAVEVTIAELQHPIGPLSPNVGDIVDRIRPAVEPLLSTAAPDSLFQEAVRANVRASAEQLRNGSALLENLIRSDGLLVIGAEYSLDTGTVEVFDGGQPAAAWE